MYDPKNKELILKNLANRISDLPALPPIVSKLMEIMNDPLTTIKNISLLINQDQALAIKVLKISNSAYYGFSRQIITIENAVKVLGFNTLKSILVSSSAANLFKNKDGSVTALQKKLWTHSLATAVIARKLSKKTYFSMISDELYVAGLIHDIGKKIIENHFPDLFIKLESLARQKSVDTIILERELLGFSHCDVGALVAEKWLLPLSLVEAIFSHHEPRLSESYQKYTYFIFVANIIANMINVNLEMVTDEEIKGIIGLEAVETLKLQEIDLIEFMIEVKEDISREELLFV